MMRDTDINDSLFEARITELAERAERYECCYRAFFTPKEQIIAKKILASKRFDGVSFLFGG